MDLRIIVGWTGRQVTGGYMDVTATSFAQENATDPPRPGGNSHALLVLPTLP